MTQSLYLHLRKQEPTEDNHSGSIRKFEDPLERWLKGELEKLYADVLEEPLPPGMEQLVRECEKRLQEEKKEN